MNEEKLEAIIEHEGDEKYIVAKPDEEDKIVLVSMPLDYHSGIARSYSERIGKSLRVMGGGILTLDKENKMIKTYGQSGSYGRPDVSIVKKILEQKFSDYTVDAKVTHYIRD